MSDPYDPGELVSGIGEAAERVLASWKASGEQVLRLEGFMGVGKTRVAKIISDQTGALLIVTDDFVDEKKEERIYAARIDRPRLQAAFLEALGTGKPVILDGVCLEETLPAAEFGRGHRVYLSRVSLPVADCALWHDIYDLEREEAEDPLQASIINYHRQHRPHNDNDLMLAIPEGVD